MPHTVLLDILAVEHILAEGALLDILAGEHILAEVALLNILVGGDMHTEARALHIEAHCSRFQLPDTHKESDDLPERAPK